MTMNKLKKHISFIYGAYLLFHIFFLGFATFHYHNIKIYTDNEHIVFNQDRESDFFDPFVDENSVCQLLAFASVLYINNPLQTISAEITLHQIYYIERSVQAPDENLFHVSNLRAPPLS